jgi:AcrR family transcriptional regulator
VAPPGKPVESSDCDVRRPRADAQRNRLRVLAGARTAVAVYGLDVSYHQIAQEASVGVGTVYRRYPNRDELLRAVLVEVLTSLIGIGERALDSPDAFHGFTEFFTEFTRRAAEHAGLSDSLLTPSGADVDAAKARLRDLIKRLTKRAQADGQLRRDVRWQDVLFLAHGTAVTAGCLLEENALDDQLERNLGVIINGLRS